MMKSVVLFSLVFMCLLVDGMVMGIGLCDVLKPWIYHVVEYFSFYSMLWMNGV